MTARYRKPTKDEMNVTLLSPQISPLSSVSALVHLHPEHLFVWVQVDLHLSRHILDPASNLPSPLLLVASSLVHRAFQLTLSKFVPFLPTALLI